MVSGFPTPRIPVAIPFILVSLIAVSIGCGGGSTGGGTGGLTPTPTPTPTASPTPTPTPTPAPAAGVKLSVAGATVPPGGIFQYQLLLTEPKPIGNSSTRPIMPKGPDGPVRGVAVNDSTGQAVGIAVINGTDISISVDSPNASLGTDVDYPLLVLTAPVLSTAAIGSTFPVALDATSLFFDGSNQYTILENNPGTLTIGGTMSITDVVPGGGVINPGDTLKILGIGFDANTKIQMNNVTLTQTFVSPSEIDVTMGSFCVPESVNCTPAPTLRLDGDRVRAINATETVTYYSYDRTADPGGSKNTLVQLVHPMFSQQFFLVGSFPFTAGGTQFTGIALQNPNLTSDATVQIELLDSAGNSLVTPVVELVPKRTELVRDLAELFPSIPAGTTTIRATVTTGPPVKMLGMVGDTSTNAVVPVVVTGK